ncbi:ubiquitin thioesterase OTU1 [Phymastichus coffea]|uniref:ubiquitin thioesterase OTU1 n=1 Tax=Phymastichus coffea TaxID=108790 RepID=UPI00273C8C84|nr:ubiquitin thioesterase OTU1 [Phymastichus coffea]XP_058794783.1 ubiquitin thioesterase OTU1 [Phymastichus coffea]XP_058794784.1 ubiquitin thioesterase OTU1 [Phymastichus coffea]XP_058794785.1 ubiquitin thioesterase OTU1 [Phymastichus coffea]
MGGFVIRVKSKSGQKIVDSLSPQDTITKLKNMLSELTGVHNEALCVLQGFPPKPLDLNNGNATLHESNISSGETLIVEEKQIDSNVEQTMQNVTRKHITENVDFGNSPGILMKMVVPADNSCLFTSVGFVLNGKVDPSCAHSMREIIAHAVAAEPSEYCEAMLGQPNTDYCNWIMKPSSWGGAIELSILSKFYGMEIAVVDSSNGIINRFGEDQHYAQRVFLIFDGIHYDPLYLEPLDGGRIQTMFPTEDQTILKQADNLAQEAKSSHQYTDIQKFTLKCMVCDMKLSGSEAAQKHAKESGHQSFGEVIN